MGLRPQLAKLSLINSGAMAKNGLWGYTKARKIHCVCALVAWDGTWSHRAMLQKDRKNKTVDSNGPR